MCVNRANRADTEQYIGVGTQRGRAMPAKFLSSRLMVRVLMAFQATGEARHGNVVSALLRDVVRLAAFSALADGQCRKYGKIWKNMEKYGEYIHM